MIINETIYLNRYLFFSQMIILDYFPQSFAEALDFFQTQKESFLLLD